MRAFALVCLGSLLACEAQPAPAPAAVPPVATPIKGRVVDDQGVGLAGVHLLFHDTTRRTGHVDARGCATYHPQFSLTSDSEGRFAGVLPFVPTRVQASGRLEWVELPLPQVITDAKQDLLLVGRAVPHLTLTGQVVDSNGQPIAGTSVLPEPSSGLALTQRSDEQGRFKLELAAPSPRTVRARRMGYRPVVVSVDALERIVLADRRPMITVNVNENGAPVGWLVRVSLWQRGERLSFCTAGPVAMTSEPRDGQCTLDAERGQVELRLEDKKVLDLTVTEENQQVTLAAPPLPPPPTGDGS